MIEYIIKDPHFFVASIKSIASIASNTVLTFGDKLTSYGMDDGRICLYELVIGKGELDIISDGEIEVLVSLPDLQKILSRLSASDEITIKYDNNMIILKSKIGYKTKTFKLSVLTGEIPKHPIETLDKLELDSIFNIGLSDFVDMVKDGELYTEFFTIKTVDNKIIIDGVGNIGSFESEYELDNEVTSEEMCNYSISLLTKILSTLGNPEVTISFAAGKPIMIYNKLSKDSYLRWYLAPRVEQDDFEDDDDDI